jgi:hypothetical protein
MRKWNPIRMLLRRWSRPDRRGQSLVEFALTLPLLLLVVVGTVDLGRAYFRTENLTNAVKEGAFFGARSPSCDTNAVLGCSDPKNVHWRVEQELNGVALDTFVAKCFDPGTTDFTGAGKALADCEDGDLYYVEASTLFDLITPIIGNLVGDTLTLGSEATSVVLTNFDSNNNVDLDPGDVTPSPLPSDTCQVPDFTNGTKLNQAQDVWTNAAHFTTTVTTVGPSGQNITWQSLSPGTIGTCSSTTIIVSNSPQATATPTATPSATPSPTATPTSGGPTPTPTPTPQATPQTYCTVPNLVRTPKLTVTQAQVVWRNAGFQAANFTASRPPNSDYQVKSQSLAQGLSQPCLTTTITVGN